MLEDAEMDLPAYWISLKVFVANSDGIVPDSKTEDVFLHFCSDKCASEYFMGSEFQHRIRTIDQNTEDQGPDE